MDAPLSPQVLATHLSPADPVADASFLAAHAADSTGAAVSPVDGPASAAAFDGITPANDSRLPISPLTDAAEGTVPLIAGSAADSSVPSSEAGALAVPTDVVGKTVPPVAGAAASTDVDAAPADDVGASAPAFEDAAGKTLVSGTASVAGGERVFLPCSPSPPDVWILRDGSCSGWGCRACRAGGKAWDLRAGAGEQSHRRETSSAAAVAAWHRRETSIVVAAAAAEACYRREMPYCCPFVGLRLQRPPRPDNHDRRQEHGGAMDVPGTGGE